MPNNNNSEIIIYTTPDGLTKVDVTYADENVWLSLDRMAQLFQRDKTTISKHIKNIFDEGELERDPVVAKFATTAADGKTYQVEHYNLDVIISVGYRVKSHRGVQFRRWASSVLKEYMRKGFAMNDELLKKAGGGSFWRELLDRIRDIRSSEKVFYRQVLDLYATSVDYDPKTPEAVKFFKIVQNKMHYAAHGHTAADVIESRANADKMFMGLTTFSGERPVKNEVVIAKNYLNDVELATLNRLVSAFFDLAEIRAIQHIPTYMSDWVAELDKFARDFGKGILPDAGIVTHLEAVEKAEREYERYRQKTVDELTTAERDYLSYLKEAQVRIETETKKLAGRKKKDDAD
ncbi:MAG: virulence RhuM family protein [Christensenellaceae bacterium]|jgi:hypothetical protein|nr:virulence RhuM family protein [Christensenellaceae bacterium]